MNMQNVINMDKFMGVQSANAEVLGKLLYFTVSKVLVQKDDMRNVCEVLDFPYPGKERTSFSDAFRSATGDIYDRLTTEEYGEIKIQKVYCRDNKREKSNILCRELVLETLNTDSNGYDKLANITYDRESGELDYNTAYGAPYHIDVYKYCEQAKDLFALYQDCVGRSSIANAMENYCDAMTAIKVSRGHMYFVPRTHMHLVDAIEDFAESVNRHNRHAARDEAYTGININAIHVIDDAKQREKMAAEFYNDVKQEIALYQEKIQHLIAIDSKSIAVMERWIEKVNALEAKKRNYEQILRRELDGLRNEFGALQFLSMELMIRSRQAERLRNAA